MSLRKAINQNCKDCVYDEIATGTWRQQASLCSVKSCALYEVRPKSTRPILESVLFYYGVENDEYQAMGKP